MLRRTILHSLLVILFCVPAGSMLGQQADAAYALLLPRETNTQAVIVKQHFGVVLVTVPVTTSFLQSGRQDSNLRPLHPQHQLTWVYRVKR